MSVFVLHINLHVAQFYLSATSNILKCNSVMLSLSVNHFNLKFEGKKLFFFNLSVRTKKTINMILILFKF